MSSTDAVNNLPEDSYDSAIPIATRLNKTFNTSKLLADLESAKSHFKPAAQFGPYHDGSWKGIALRNVDGDASSTVAMTQGACKDTDVMKHCPYFQEIFENLGFPVQTARILFLPPGKKIGHHRDHFSWTEGIVRLHIPIITDEKVIFMLGGKQWHWKPGEFWFGDFNRYHSFDNQSDITRVHLVIDCLLNETLLGLFPEDEIKNVRDSIDIRTHDEELDLPSEVLEGYCGYFALPKTASAIPLVGKITKDNNRLVVSLIGIPFSYTFTPTSEEHFTCQGFDLTFLADQQPPIAQLKNAATELDIQFPLTTKKTLSQSALALGQAGIGRMGYSVLKGIFKAINKTKIITGVKT